VSLTPGVASTRIINQFLILSPSARALRSTFLLCLSLTHSPRYSTFFSCNKTKMNRARLFHI
jgi:hypothetical protein